MNSAGNRKSKSAAALRGGNATATASAAAATTTTTTTTNDNQDDAQSSSSMLERAIRHLESNGMKKEALLLAWLLLLLLRWMVGLHSYSGASTPPMFGDYEAQRHWMEITLQLPVSDWYFNTTANDLLYWGLDYPPLTAFVSYAFGFLAQRVDPAMIELAASRGYESATSKVFMRTSVILCDIAVFIPAVFYLARVLYKRQQWTQRIMLPLILLSQPALLLIDHGHFQYNNVTLGLTAFAVALIVRSHEFFGSIAFCLALNFKQMALYYVPAFGVFLFARCVYRSNFLLHLAKLGIAVVGTFAILWFPFCVYTAENETCATSVQQVLHRIFPFARGLFEDKVANFWCVLDLVYKIKRHVTPVEQMRLCTLATFLGFLPSVVDLIRRKPTRLRFILALANSSLSFFLFSFQVHEKTILIPLLPISILFGYSSLLAGWFSFLSTFSMYFLLKKDGLILPYFALQLFFLSVGVLPFLAKKSYLHINGIASAPGYCVDGTPHMLFRAYVAASIAGVAAIHLAQAVIAPPARYPHIHDYLFAAYSCGHFLLTLGYCTYWQWTAKDDEADESSEHQHSTKRKTE